MRRVRNFVSGDHAANVFLQQPARRVPRMFGHRFDHVLRSRAGGAKRGFEHRRRRDRAVGDDELHAAGGGVARGALQVQPRYAVENDSGKGSQGDPQRFRRRGNRIQLPARRPSSRLCARLRGRADLARSPLQGNRIGKHPRSAGILHEYAAVPLVQRRAPEEGKPVRSLQRQIDQRSHRDVDQAGGRVLRRSQDERAGD